VNSGADWMPDTGKLMSFREHLMELRKRLVRATFIVVIGCFVTWEYRIELFGFLSKPVADALADNGIYTFQTITLTESIVVYMKTTFVGALFFLSPYIFWELWAFISPGLYSKEKRFVLPLTVFSVAFFILGAAFAYTILLPFLTDWLVNLTLEGGHADVMVTLQNTYGFAFSFLLMFGLVFELPLVLFFLALWGMVTGKGLLKFWRYFVVLSFIVSGVLTPPDPISQTMMAVPLNVLYGFGVVTAFTVTRARASGRADASRLALRAMALSMLAMLLLGIGLFLYLSGLPEKPLAAWVGPETTFAAGMNPRVLGNEKAVLGLVRGIPEASALVDTIIKATPLDDITEGMILGEANGQRAILLRAGGLADALEPMPANAARVDDDTVAFGSPELIKAIAAREPVTQDLGPAGKRLMGRLALSGPLWVWLPPASPMRPALLGLDNARDLTSVGAALSLGERRLIVFDIPLERAEDDTDAENAAERADRSSRADRVLGRIEAARVAALSRTSGTKNEVLAKALTDLASEIEAIAAPDAKVRIQAIKAALAGGDTLPVQTFPALTALASHLQGVSVRREDKRLTLTAELDDEGLSALFTLISGQP